MKTRRKFIMSNNSTITAQFSVVNCFLQKQLAKYAANLGIDVDTPLKIRLLPPKNTPDEVKLARGLAFKTKDGKTVANSKHGYIFPYDADITVQKSSADKSRLITDGKFETHYGKGYNVYAVVNTIPLEQVDFSRGDDESVVSCRALFYEYDDVGLEEQWQKLSTLEAELGREATMVVRTYKSLHVYFTLEDTCTKAEWVLFQQRLIQKMESDSSLWNPARIMRMPGFSYRKFEGNDIKEMGVVEIVKESGNRFSLAEFNGLLPDWDDQRWGQKIKQHNKQTGRSGLKGQIELPKLEDMQPFDMRLMAPYLPDYVEGGRQGWDTCRCPVHAMEGDHSGDSLHINRETGAYRCHAGCSTQRILRATQTIALSAGYSPKQPKKWKSLPFEPDFVCSSRYFPTDIPLPTHPLILVKGAVGLGKSHMVANWLKGRKKLKVEAILPRITLERDSAAKYGLKAKNDMDVWKPFESDCCYCINSIPQAQAVPDILIIDEVVQVLSDAFTSSTMYRNRSDVLDALKNKIIQVVRTGGRVIFMDAHINKATAMLPIDLLGLARKDVYLIHNTHPGQVRKHEVSSNIHDRELMLQQWREAAISGKRLLFVCDSIDMAKSEYHSLIKRGITPEAILLVTSETAERDKNVKDFAANPDAFLATNPHVRIVIASPSLQSGVSITRGDFERGYACYTGVFNPRLMVQQMARYRPAMDWYMWVPKYAQTNKYRYTDAELLLQDWGAKTDDALALLDLKAAVVRGRKAQDVVNDMRKEPFLRCAAELICEDNFEKINLATELQTLLEESGQICVEKQWVQNEDDKATAKTLRKDRKETRKALKEQEIDDILAQPLLDDDEVQAIHQKQKEGQRITTAEYRQLQRTEIEEIVAQLPDTERDMARKTAAKAIIQENGKANLRRLWQILRNPSEALNTNQHRLLTELEKRFPWLPELDFSATQLSFYKVSGIYDLVLHVMDNKPFSYTSPEVEKVMSYVLSNKEEARKYLTDKIASTKSKDPEQWMRVIKQILAVFGIPVHLARKDKEVVKLWQLDGTAMWEPWKVIVYHEFKVSAKSVAREATPIKQSVGAYTITTSCTTPCRQGQSYEFFFDGDKYYFWDEVRETYFSLSPEDFRTCCQSTTD